MVGAVHLVLLGLLTVLTDALYGTDAHHGWWLFVVLNFVACIVCLVTWLTSSKHNENALPKRTV
jgi:hypothetical protein